MALDAKKEAEIAMESMKGSVQKLKNDVLKTGNSVKTETKKKSSNAVNSIQANGHARAAGLLQQISLVRGWSGAQYCNTLRLLPEPAIYCC